MSECRLLSLEEAQERIHNGWHVEFLANGQPSLPCCAGSSDPQLFTSTLLLVEIWIDGRG